MNQAHGANQGGHTRTPDMGVGTGTIYLNFKTRTDRGFR